MRFVWLLSILLLILPEIRGSTRLLLANRRDIRLIDVQRPRGNNTRTIISNLDDAAALDFLYSDGIIFWTDINLEMIKRTSLNESGVESNIITTGLTSPDGLACDWLTKKLYWSDSETNRIEVSNLDGGYRKVLFWEDLDQPRAIALVPTEGLIFWTDWGEGAKIERAGMDGDESTRLTIVNTQIFWPNGLTIDYDARRVYWADAKLNFISNIDFNGHNRRTVIEGDLPHPFALTVQGDTLYWTDWQTRAIHMCHKVTGSNRRPVLVNIQNPMDIQVFSADRQPFSETPCNEDNGGCSHLCLLAPSPKNFSCACPTGIRLLKDNKTCSDGFQKMLFLARRTDIRRISLDTLDYTDVVLQIDGVRHAVAIDFDPIEKQIYWTDDEALVIRRAGIDGSNQEDLIVSEVDHPDGIAVDWVARNLYWTDTGTDRIEVARLNGTSRKVLVTEKLEEPRAILVDPTEGYMYWTDWGKKPKIERAALDGCDRVVLVDNGLGWPNGLALDYERQKIYWGDAKTDKIEFINTDGSDRRVLVSDHLPHIFGFSLLGDYVYWTDWQRRSIERVHKTVGDRRQIIVDQLPDLMGLKAVDVRYTHGTNPCAVDNGECSHLCLNKPNGTYVCACPMGLELTTNERSCILPEAFLLFSRRSDIRRISLETNHNDVVIPLAGVKNAIALDFDINDNRIYWTDITLKSISRAFMNGSNLEHVIEFGLEFPEGMAVDWVARNVYWADTGTARIEVARLDGSSRKVLLWKDLDNPRSIALDPNFGYMYWSDWGKDNRRIERAAMDGSKRSILISTKDRANGLTIDYKEKKLYWTNLDGNSIQSLELFGNFQSTVISEKLEDPFGLTQYQDYLYWTDMETRSIERANKTNGENRTRIQGQLDYIMDIHVFHSSRQSGWNLCAVNNGGCSHLCLAQPSVGSRYTNAHSCACPTHFTLREDNKTCESPSSFLLFSQKNTISRVVIDTTESPDIILPIHGPKNIKAITYDSVSGFLYWIDGRTQTIRRASDNGSNVGTVIPNPSDLFHPYDVAIDPYTRVMFWTCAKNNVINVTRLDMTSVGVVVSGADQKPRSIVLHPSKGLMFWTNVANQNPKIERAAMDGMQPTTLFTTDLEEIAALAIDTDNDVLFWIESSLKIIETADIHGANRKVLINSQLIQPISLAVYDKYLYWIDRESQIIERVNKLTGEGRERILGRLPMLSDLFVVKQVTTEELASHPCNLDNSQCSHLCISVDIDALKSRCSCPNTLVLTDDDHDCGEPPTCNPDQFTCESGLIDCIPNVWRCDGSVECEDHSDEIDCPPCSESQLRCHNGLCIDTKRVCDGVSDCQDDSDEERCCRKDEFQCKSQYECVPSTVVCDGKSDCRDGSDERAPCMLEYTPKEVQRSQTDANITMGVVSFFAVVAVLALFVWYCRRRNRPPIDDENLTMIASTNKTQLQPTTNGIAPSTSRGAVNHGSRLSARCANNPTVTLQPSTLRASIKSSSGPTYDRNYVTGASSSSSSATRYPQETLNPPPSPVTDRSQCTAYEYCCSQSSVPSYRGWYRGYSHRPPNTTPCSTDDSEPYHSNPARYRQQRCYRALLGSGGDSGSSPIPPPPTPRSCYLSDDNSCPPSPNTERSYFDPCPPPPSPVAPSDC